MSLDLKKLYKKVENTINEPFSISRNGELCVIAYCSWPCLAHGVCHMLFAYSAVNTSVKGHGEP